MNLDDVTDRSVAIIMFRGSCLHCGKAMYDDPGYWELTWQPDGAKAGRCYRVCSNTCLALFIQGGEA